MTDYEDYDNNLAFDPHKQELLSQIANMELRDQLEAKEQMIKNYKKAISSALNYMACPDDLTEINGKCNDQMAFDILREVLK